MPLFNDCLGADTIEPDPPPSAGVTVDAAERDLSLGGVATGRRSDGRFLGAGNAARAFAPGRGRPSGLHAIVGRELETTGPGVRPTHPSSEPVGAPLLTGILLLGSSDATSTTMATLSFNGTLAEDGEPKPARLAASTTREMTDLDLHLLSSISVAMADEVPRAADRTPPMPQLEGQFSLGDAFGHADVVLYVFSRAAASGLNGTFELRSGRDFTEIGSGTYCLTGAAVPLRAALPLLGSALAGLGFTTRPARPAPPAPSMFAPATTPGSAAPGRSR